jgi:broad specificity phosphatase PhoE
VGKLNISDEERQRRSELAKRLHAQGQFGGRQPGSGRPRKKRAAEVVAEGAAERGEQILQVFDDAMSSKQPASVRVKAATELLKIEHSEAELKIKENQALDGMSNEQLVALIAERFGRLQSAGALPPGMEDFIELEAEELPDEDDEVAVA